MHVKYEKMTPHLVGKTLTRVDRGDPEGDTEVARVLLPAIITGYRPSYLPVMDGEHQQMRPTGEYTPSGLERAEPAYDETTTIGCVLEIQGAELGFGPDDSCEVTG